MQNTHLISFCIKYEFAVVHKNTVHRTHTARKANVMQKEKNHGISLYNVTCLPRFWLLKHTIERVYKKKANKKPNECMEVLLKKKWVKSELAYIQKIESGHS